MGRGTDGWLDGWIESISPLTRSVHVFISELKTKNNIFYKKGDPLLLPTALMFI